MIRAVLGRATLCLLEGHRLPSVPRALEVGAQHEPISLGDYLELDDAVISVAMRAWEDSTDPILSDLCRRVRGRALFKTVELFGEQANPVGRERALAARARGGGKVGPRSRLLRRP